MEEDEKLCDRIAIMDHGRILQTGSLGELAKVAGANPPAGFLCGIAGREESVAVARPPR
jgi:ABC-type multidrug transport system ATPase subunit